MHLRPRPLTGGRSSLADYLAILLLVGGLILFGLLSSYDLTLTQERSAQLQNFDSTLQEIKIPPTLQRIPSPFHSDKESGVDYLLGPTITPQIEPPVTPLPVTPTATEVPVAKPITPAAEPQPTPVTVTPAPTPSPSTTQFDPPARLIPTPRLAELSHVAPKVLGSPDNNDSFRTLVKATQLDVVLPGSVGSVRSPSNKAELTVYITQDGSTGYRVIDPATGAIILGDALLDLRVDFKHCLFRPIANPAKTVVQFSISSGTSLWTPPMGGFERKTYKESYTSFQVWCEGTFCQHHPWKMEWRLFDSGLGVRALIKPGMDGDTTVNTANVEEEWVHVSYGLQVSLPNEFTTECWAANFEQPYQTTSCRHVFEEMMSPMTATVTPTSSKSPQPTYGAYSFLQTAGFSFTQSMLKTADTMVPSLVILNMVAKGEASVHPTLAQEGVGDLTMDEDMKGIVTSTSWHVMLWTKEVTGLSDASSIVRLLAPPTPAHLASTYADINDWIHPGKLLRIRRMDTDSVKLLIDFAKQHYYNYVHFDAGWYGDENDPKAVATDILPSLKKNLDMKAVVAYAHAQKPPIGVTLYVNELALRDTEKLVKLYQSWGIDGIKFGFVQIGKPAAVRLTHSRMIAYASAKMFVNIHDWYRPRSFSRTYPHLLTQEGIRGEERTPDGRHHTILPFTRFLAGAADYTPRYVSSLFKCTKAHQLVLPIVFFSPIQSLFWAEDYYQIKEAAEKTNMELGLWETLPTVWDDTLMLSGAIGEYVTIARRRGSRWYIGSVNSDEKERTVTIDLSPIWRARGSTAVTVAPFDYVLEVWADSDDYRGLMTNGTLNQLQVKPIQFFYLPTGMPTQALPLPKNPLWTNLTEWSRKKKQTIKPMTSLSLQAKLAPSGGYGVRLRPAKDFLKAKGF